MDFSAVVEVTEKSMGFDDFNASWDVLPVVATPVPGALLRLCVWDGQAGHQVVDSGVVVHVSPIDLTRFVGRSVNAPAGAEL
jgi:hypothetical protein